ncbi:MAG TPA: CdaR family protein [Vicinamibacterales bacterium]|nr:CdaR family protein [Vicinamibacterales bacterium]
MRYHPFRHLGLKLLSVALATLLWLTVAGEHVVERSLRVPLEFRNIPAELEIVGDPPSTIDVRVRGTSAQLSKLEPGEIVAVIDLGAARPGARMFHLRNDEISAPFGVEVTQVAQPTVSLDLEQSARRTVPIVPAIQGDPASGFVVGRITSNPATVEVVGPVTRVRQVAGATTEPVSVAGARARVRDVVTVGVLDSSVRLAKPISASVVIDILPAPVERELANVALRPRQLAAGRRVQFRPSTVDVTVRGSRDAVAALSTGTLQAYVDLAGLRRGRYNLRVHVDPIENVGVTRIDPATTSVTIR